MKIAHHAITWQNAWADAGQPCDPAALVAEAAAAGYAGLEVEQAGGVEAGRWLDLMRPRGVVPAAVSACLPAVPYEPAIRAFEASLAFAEGLGVETVMLCGGFLGCKRRTVFAVDYERFAGVIRGGCDAATQHGLHLAFHPHMGCLVETPVEVDRLLEALGRVPDNFGLCPDTGHLAAVGCDPIGFIRTYPDLIRHVHLKDWWGEPGGGRFVELGRGNAGLDFTAIDGALEQIGYAGWRVVETDRPTGPAAASASASFQHLTRRVPVPA